VIGVSGEHVYYVMNGGVENEGLQVLNMAGTHSKIDHLHVVSMMDVYIGRMMNFQILYLCTYSFKSAFRALNVGTD
jgi:hypothetical protein